MGSNHMMQDELPLVQRDVDRLASACFDIDLAMETLAQLASAEQVREALGRRHRPRPASGTVSGDAVEMGELGESQQQEVPMAPEGSIEAWGPALLELDPALAVLRFKLVPRVVPEQVFWARVFCEAASALQDRFSSGCSATQELSEQRQLVGEMACGLLSAYGDMVGGNVSDATAQVHYAMPVGCGLEEINCAHVTV